MIALASGQKVFPEDIEAVLLKHPDVVDAVVVGLSRPAGPEVHAALVLRQGQAEAVVTAANRQLADHQQVRGSTVWLDAPSTCCVTASSTPYENPPDCRPVSFTAAAIGVAVGVSASPYVPRRAGLRPMRRE